MHSFLGSAAPGKAGTGLSAGVKTGRNRHARTPKSELLNLLLLALQRSKINIAFRCIS